MQVRNDNEVFESRIDDLPEIVKDDLANKLEGDKRLVIANLKPGKEVEFMGLKCIITRLELKTKNITLRML